MEVEGLRKLVNVATQIFCEVNCQVLRKNPEAINEAECGTTPLIFALLGKKKNVVKWLLENKADPNIQSTSKGLTALHIAALQGDLDCVHMLLATKGTRLNIRNSQGLAPADLAYAEGHVEVIKLILEKNETNLVEYLQTLKLIQNALDAN